MMSEENKTLDIESFGEIVNSFLKENHIQMLIDMPEGNVEPKIRDNTRLGAVVQFYILIQAIGPIYKSLYDAILDHDKSEDFIDAMLSMVKEELMAATEEERD